MAVYKFRITFEDHEDVSRDLEIKSTQTFEDLHSAILSSIGFDNKELASFFLSDDNWKKGKEITLADMSDGEKKIPMMKKSRLCDFIADPHQKFYYVYDYVNEWAFHVELLKIIVSEDNGILYPRCVKISGDAPKQHDTSPKAVPVPEDFNESEVYVEETNEVTPDEPADGEDGEKISLDGFSAEADAEEEPRESEE